jgi:transcriptional regulator, XRE family
MEDSIIIGERIRKIREDLKMNRERFSEMIDISDVFLGQIERGERSLSTKTLVKIVKFTGVSADFILFGNEESNNTLAKINRILNKCSNDFLNYIYNLIHTTFNYVKKS